MTHSLYTIRTTATGYTIAKFDADLNLEASYELTAIDKGEGNHSSLPYHYTCSCPAGPRPSCKHRKMLPIFLAKGAIDTDRFYDYERQTWHQPIVAYGEPEAPKEELERVETAVVGEALGSPAPVFNPTAGIPKTSYGPKDSPSSDNATWFSTVQPPTKSEAPAPVITQFQPIIIRRRI